MKFLHHISQNFSRLLLVIRIVLGVIRLASGVGKLIDASAAVNFLKYLLTTMNKPLPVAPETLMLTLSVLEIVLSVLFLTGRLLKPAMFLLNVLLGGFTVILASSVGDNNVPTCGCSGVFDFGMPVEAALVRNIVLMILVAAAWQLLERQRTMATQNP